MTSWTLVQNAAEQTEAKARLYGLYGAPLRRVLMNSLRCSEQDAEEYTQDFLVYALLEGTILGKVDRTRGQFRSYFAKSCVRHALGKLRKRQERVLDEVQSDLLVDRCIEEAGDAFDTEWARALLQRVADDVKAECERKGQQLHWRIFEERDLLPALELRPAPSLPEICQRLGIASPAEASKMRPTVQRKFPRILKQHLLESTGAPNGIDQAMQDFLAIFFK